MSGYEQIMLAQEFAKEREAEYKKQCVEFLRNFCEDFSKFLGVQTCGQDNRVGANGINMSERQVSYTNPPFFDQKNASVWTRITVRTNGKRCIDVSVWHYGDRFLIKTLEQLFDGCEREQVFLYIKDFLIQGEDDLDSKIDWQTRDGSL